MSTSVSVKKTAGKAVVPKRQKKSEFYKLRLKQALTIEAAAELMGVTTQTIQSWDQKGAPKLATAYLQLREKHDLSCWGPEWKGFYFSHRRGRLCYKRSMSFDPKTLQQVESWLAVYNRVESAKVRYTMDGISQQEAIAIAFGAPLVTQSNVYKNACDGTVINSNGGRL